MAYISGERALVTVEEVAEGAAVSSAVGNKLGAALNLYQVNETACLRWTLNGPYYVSGSPQSQVDGEYILHRPMTLVAIHMWNQVAGTAGTLELDILRKPSAGGSASIFSTTPKILFSSGNDSTLYRDFDLATTPWNPAGSIAPVLATSNFSAYDKLILNIQQVQSGGKDAGIALYFRLR